MSQLMTQKLPTQEKHQVRFRQSLRILVAFACASPTTTLASSLGPKAVGELGISVAFTRRVFLGDHVGGSRSPATTQKRSDLQ